MSFGLPVRIGLVLLLSGCSFSGSSSRPPIVITKEVTCPSTPPPICERWEYISDDDFELNTDLKKDRIKGHMIHGECLVRLDSYHKSYDLCPKPEDE